MCLPLESGLLRTSEWVLQKIRKFPHCWYFMGRLEKELWALFVAIEASRKSKELASTPKPVFRGLRS